MARNAGREIGAPPGWLVMLQQLPARPSNLRVATWRRLRELGAVQLKNSAYVLPDTPETREDLAWLRSEIISGGGEAMVLEGAGLPRDEVRAVTEAFAKARATEYAALARSIEAFRKRAARTAGKDRHAIQRSLRGFNEQLLRIDRRDFFASPSRVPATTALAALEALLQPGTAPSGGSANPAHYRRKVWLTRPRPGIDRMACAWLIRRCIDPAARFAFAGSRGGHRQGVRFDMFDGEFTHENGLCTFEVMARRFRIDDSAVLALAQIVHDVDLKETRYGRPEAATAALLVEGLRRTYERDADLLEHGMRLFEWLHASLVSSPAGRRKRKE